MRHKFRGEDNYYVLVQEGGNLVVPSQDFQDMEYLEFAKIHKRPHDYHFHKPSGKLRQRATEVQDGERSERDSQSAPPPHDGGHISLAPINSPSRRKTGRETRGHH